MVDNRKSDEILEDLLNYLNELHQVLEYNVYLNLFDQVEKLYGSFMDATPEEIAKLKASWGGDMK